MRVIMWFNLLCCIWMAFCFYMNWDGWLQVCIIVPNMIGWTVLQWLVERP